MKVYQSAASLMLLLGASSAQDFTGNNLRGAFDAMKAAAKAKYADVNDIADFSPAFYSRRFQQTSLLVTFLSPLYQYTNHWLW